MNPELTREAEYLRQILAHNVLYLRKKRRLSREELSELSGVSVNAISKVEKQQTYPRLDILAGLAKGLDLPLKRLLDPDLDPAAVFPYHAEEGMQRILNEIDGLSEYERDHLYRLLDFESTYMRSRTVYENKWHIE